VLAVGVALADEPAISVVSGELVEGMACAADSSQTYTLYLPPGYTSERRWPVLMVFDPRGRSVLAAELFLEAARDYGWIIVSSNDTRSDGSWDPNIKAVAALWPEVHIRFQGDPRRIYAAGFSGGATVAHALAKKTGEIAGVIACGGPFVIDRIEGMDAPVFGTTGNLDFNYQELGKLDAFLAEQGNPHRMVVFDGAHSWMPPSVARQAVEWMELLAIKRGLREPDPEMVKRLYSKDVAVAEELALEGRQLEAAERLRAVVRTFDGLHDIDAARVGAEQLEASPEARRQRKEEKRWRAFESRSIEALTKQVGLLRFSELPPPSQQPARELQIDGLLRRAGRPGAEGEAVQRVLNLFYTQFSFYLARDFLDAGRYDRAATSLELALRIRSDNAVAWYNLACCRAQLHRSAAAVAALERAVEVGFDRSDLLSADTDLDSLRGRADFNALLAAINSS
jgi:predicted esterase